MDKLRMMSMDNVQMNVEKIQKLFPNAVTEVLRDGKPTLAIDFDMLKQELSAELIDDKEERYQMTWPDKKKSILLANTPISATLRPCKEESVDFDHTQNLYIEGDNLDVLKLLQETYLGKIKMIYIDPPYNTGNDFVYNDDFRVESEEWSEMSGDYDEQGNRLVQNTESNGRFHTDWLNMIYPRLKVARDLLKDEGIVFISIDDSEVDNLRKICDEVFGADNFIAQIVVEGTPKNDPKIISTAHEYCLVYVRDYETAKSCEWGIANPIYNDLLNIVRSTQSYKSAEELIRKYYKDNNLKDDNISNYNRVDEKGLFRIGPIDDPQSGGSRDIRYNPVTGEALKTPNRGWGCSIETWKEWVKNGEILFPEDNAKLCSRKVYIEDGKLDLLRAYFKIQTRKDTDMLKNMFGKKVFSFPKPLELIKTFVDSSTESNDIVMDFFSGSGTTAHAVMQLNLDRLSKGDKQVKYILVQIPEDLYKNLSVASGNREKQICQNAIDFCVENNMEVVLTSVGKERIRRAGKKIKEENPSATNLDVGFRVLKLDSSNMKDVYYKPSDYSQGFLGQLEDNIKADRTPLDLLFQVMLELGKPLSAKIEEREIAGKHVFVVDDNDLVACFDSNVTEDVVKTIAQLKPLYAVFRDSGLSSDSVGANFDQIFATYSPNTTRKVL
jgi:site-specific DNA-methyltransferase (adenine-specific)